nr:hypothetical protein [Rhodoferax sp. MIZ03]
METLADAAGVEDDVRLVLFADSGFVLLAGVLVTTDAGFEVIST